MRRDAHRTGDVLAGREGERLVAEEVADSERIVAHGELGEFTGGPPKAIAIAAAGGTGRRPRRLRRWSRWMQLIARSTAGQLRPSRYQQMVLAEPAQRARLLHAAVAALPPHQLHRSTERRNIMQLPQSPAVPDAITPAARSRSRPGAIPPLTEAQPQPCCCGLARRVNTCTPGMLNIVSRRAQ